MNIFKVFLHAAITLSLSPQLIKLVRVVAAEKEAFASLNAFVVQLAH